MRKALFAMLLCCFSLAAAAQGTLKGKLIDSTTRQPLSLATVTVFKAADTTILTYRLSTETGEFKIPGLPLNLPLRAVVSFSGYGVERKEFTLTDAQSTLDIGNVDMMPDAQSLDEVLVISERPPVVVKKDTIEFNASAFKTLPNALVEDLLKKLPGVQVDRDGNITVNGKPVNRIQVDGKSFFGDDPKMATRNLPANVIDKVQVTDDKEELLRNGDDNLNNVGKVVNITLKKGVKKGWFGKLYGGAGTQSTYEAGGIANIYRDTLQVSVLGYMNNLNRPGFSYTELMQAGGMERNRNSLSGNSTSIWNNGNGSGVSINGINFGGSQNLGGISTSKGAGFNVNHSPNNKQSIFLQYFHGNVRIDRRIFTGTQQFNEDTIISNNSVVTGGIITNAHNIGAGTRLKPDSVTNIQFNANYLIGLHDEDKISAINSNNNKLGPLSTGDIFQNTEGKTYIYRHSFNITRLSRKKAGRRFTVAHNMEVNNRFFDYTTESEQHYIYPTAYDSILSQLRQEKLPRTDLFFMANYSEPLSKKLTVRMAGRYEYGKLGNGVNTFNKNGDDKYEVINPGLSSRFNRESNRAFVSPGLEFKHKSLTITPGVRFLWQSVNNRLASLGSPLIQQQTNLLPALSIVYKQLNVNYTKDIVLPGFSYLLPVSDNTNPYFITIGNTALKPTERNGVSVNYYFNNPKRNLNIGLNGSYNWADNDVVQSISVNDKGVQTMMPVNVDGTRSAWLNFNVYKQYKNNQKRIWSWNFGGYYSYNHNRFIFNSEASWQNNFQVNSWAGLSINFNDKVEINSNYSIGSQFTKNTNAAFKKLTATNQWLDNELVVRWPKHVIWETQLNYNYNGAVPAGMQKEVIRWNAALNFTMLPGEAGVLKFTVFDILKRNNAIWVQTNRNMITTTVNNFLPQYFMATFTYNVRAAGAKKKVGGRERLFFF